MWMILISFNKEYKKDLNCVYNKLDSRQTETMWGDSRTK
jgi:hypothetical protein